MKSLVIAEKPSVARDIARVLKCSKKLNGAIEGNRYIITWGLGHLVTLADPEDYNVKYKEWKMEHLPMMPNPFKIRSNRTDRKTIFSSQEPDSPKRCRGNYYRYRCRERGRTGGPSDP